MSFFILSLLCDRGITSHMRKSALEVSLIWRSWHWKWCMMWSKKIVAIWQLTQLTCKPQTRLYNSITHTYHEIQLSFFIQHNFALFFANISNNIMSPSYYIYFFIFSYQNVIGNWLSTLYYEACSFCSL